MDRTLALTAAAVVVAGLGATWIAATLLAPTVDERFAQCTAGSVAGGNIGGPFTLVSETGATVTETDVITAPTLVYFGFTNCPDFCPMDAHRNGLALDIAEKDHGTSANALFISIDPARDTPEVVGLYADNFHDRMIGLTGSDEQIAQAAGAYRVLYSRGEGDDEFYNMNHSTFTYVVLPEHGFVDFLARDVTPEDAAERLACFAKAAS